MGKFDGVLLVSDICETLVDTSGGPYVKGKDGEPVPVLERDRLALEYFTAEGGKFTIATGRPLKYAQFYADSVPVNAPGVLGDGAAICDIRSGEYLEINALGEQVRELAQAVVDRFPATTVTVRHLDGKYLTARPDDESRINMKMSEDMEEVSSLREVPLPIQRLWVRGGGCDTLAEVQDFLRGQAGDGAYELEFTSEKMDQLQMAAKGADKGSMVRRLAARLGISMEHVYCAGNGDDDVSMLTAAKQGFAPLDCARAVRNCGAKVVCRVGEGALAEVVGILDKKY